jgi:hypothetical protein
MEFTETIQDEKFIFTSINESNLLVTGSKAAYIIYRSGSKWRCADAIPMNLLKMLGDAVDRNLGISTSVNSK